MEWLDDVRLARGGDTAALARLCEYLTPFVHGVALAHAPHHLVDALVPRALTEAAGGLPGVADERLVGQHFAAVARRLAREAAGAAPGEQPGPSPQVTEARQVLARLRPLPETTRERLLLRLVEGIPGPELGLVLRALEGEVKADLERGAAEAARLLGQPPPPPGDGYLWALAGAPSPLFARLELLLPVLRFDGVVSAPAPVPTAATHLDLGAIADRRPAFTAAEPTTPLGVAQPTANPFEATAATVAATDLPAAAQRSASTAGLAPATSPAPRPSHPASAPPARASSPPRPAAPPETATTTASLPKVAERAPTTAPDAVDATHARLEPVSAQATHVRLDAVADRAPPSEPPPTHVRLDAVADRAPPSEPPPTHLQLPRVASSPSGRPAHRLLVGSSPALIAGVMVLASVAAGWTGLSRSEAQQKRGWRLVPVVVAAEDLLEGDTLVEESVAVRQVPEDMAKSASFVKPDSLAFVAGQRLVAPLQEGDPLCWSHFADLERTRRLVVQQRARAYTVPTTVLSSIGRHLKPGDRVDVVASLERPLKPAPDTAAPSPDGPDELERVAVTVLQNTLVLATGDVLPNTRASALDERRLAYSNVSLLVLPEEATTLALAGALGTLTLTLRREDDDDVLDPVRREWTNIDTLLTGERTRELLKRRSAVITLIRGGAAP
jgi:pilus assembly protein CpaB